MNSKMISTTQSRIVAIAAAAGLALGFASVARASIVVIQDSFTVPGGASNAGRTPDVVDLPGSTWTHAFGGDSIPAGSVNYLAVNPDNNVSISIASAGSYVKPTDFVISAKLNLNGGTEPSGSPDGVSPIGLTLGFFVDPGSLAFNTYGGPIPGAITNPNAATRRAPLGIAYTPNGELQLIDYNIGSGSALATVGGFSTTGFHTVAYEVNTISGNIFNVTFDGSPVAISGTGLATDGFTMWAGVYSRTGGGDGFVDDFTISAVVPEPSTILLFGIGGLVLWRRVRRGMGATKSALSSQ